MLQKKRERKEQEEHKSYRATCSRQAVYEKLIHNLSSVKKGKINSENKNQNGQSEEERGRKKLK